MRVSKNCNYVINVDPKSMSVRNVCFHSMLKLGLIVSTFDNYSLRCKKIFKMFNKKQGSSLSLQSEKVRLKAARAKARRIFKKRNELKILLDNVDVTPSSLKNIAMYNALKVDKTNYSHIDMMKSQGTGDAIFSTLTSAAVLQSHLQTVNLSYSLGTTATPDDEELYSGLVDDFEELKEIDSSEVELKNLPQEVRIPPMPTTLSLVLTETPLVYILEMASVSAEVGTEEGKEVEKDNEYYDYLTVGKGRNRKTTNAEIQTAVGLLKNRCTYAERIRLRNNHAFASGWDMLDTYEMKEHGGDVLKSEAAPEVKKCTTWDAKTQDECDNNNQMEELVKNIRFQNCVIIMERILANNVFNVEQKRFRGLIKQDPFRPDIAFKYNLALLWTFKNEATEGFPVTSMHWNPANQDILAVGYGKFFYGDNRSGFVFCWNIKNPSQPEREYHPKKPVTAVAFSTLNPNLLAIGLYDGMVHLVDISAREVRLISCTSPTWSASNEPVWQVAWLPPDDYHPNNEHLVCVTEDGRVSRLINAKTNELLSLPLMRVLPIEGRVKGVHQLRHCPVSDVPISKCSAALIITKHSTDRDLYYIGTDEGTIHRCSRNYLNQHIDMFLAHNGPVYSCEFSPFCKKLFLTCGADWFINIWSENIAQPLITLSTSMETIEGAVWCPSDSTVIANISGTDIVIWDIMRRIYLPASIHKSPTNSRNTLIRFTDSGSNLVVADIDGNVHIFSLQDMPFPPFYQGEMLMQVLKRMLYTKRDLIEQLDKDKDVE